MARITFKKGEEYAIRLSKFGIEADRIAGKAIYAGADLVANAIKKRLKDNIDDPAYVGKRANGLLKGMNYEQTGALVESFGIASITKDKNGDLNAKVGFDGYDKNGVPNQLKARAMESGTSLLRKRPFVRPAVNATRQSAINAMKKVIDQEAKKIFDK